ncbi:MAG TPA: hypothetical protein VFF43_16330 [Caldimonas sp.]|nr:hypothetical protein [Caldimonas sp.]
MDAVIACADLVERTGAKSFRIGYLADDPSRDWYAEAQYQGARISVGDQPGPVEAADALSRRLLAGGRCLRCDKPIALNDSPGTCRWTRNGARWAGSCPQHRKPKRARR